MLFFLHRLKQFLICAASAQAGVWRGDRTPVTAICLIMFESISTFVAYVGEVVESLQVPKEPLPAEEFTVEGTNNMLLYLTYALSDDPNFRHFWPHTVSEADAVIEQLRMIAKAVQFGSRKNKDIVQCFVDHRGLHMLVKCLLSFRTPSGIRAQGWQSLCLVLQNVKDRDVRHAEPQSHMQLIHANVTQNPSKVLKPLRASLNVVNASQVSLLVFDECLHEPHMPRLLPWNTLDG